MTRNEVATALAEREVAVGRATTTRGSSSASWAWTRRAVRAGFVHYNDEADARRLVAAVARWPRGRRWWRSRWCRKRLPRSGCGFAATVPPCGCARASVDGGHRGRRGSPQPLPCDGRRASDVAVNVRTLRVTRARPTLTATLAVNVRTLRLTRARPTLTATIAVNVRTLRVTRARPTLTAPPRPRPRPPRIASLPAQLAFVEATGPPGLSPRLPPPPAPPGAQPGTPPARPGAPATASPPRRRARARRRPAAPRRASPRTPRRRARP